jgi:hypothetical protein
VKVPETFTVCRACQKRKRQNNRDRLPILFSPPSPARNVAPLTHSFRERFVDEQRHYGILDEVAALF